MSKPNTPPIEWHHSDDTNQKHSFNKNPDVTKKKCRRTKKRTRSTSSFSMSTSSSSESEPKRGRKRRVTKKKKRMRSRSSSTSSSDRSRHKPHISSKKQKSANEISVLLKLVQAI